MIAVIFEVVPHEGAAPRYLDIAASLLPALQAGRSAVFSDYRLRVAAVLRDHGLHDRTQAPKDTRSALR